MAEKILIASGKGGVGKSTIVSFLGKQAAENGKHHPAVPDPVQALFENGVYHQRGEQ